jgi:hypothetical protein
MGALLGNLEGGSFARGHEDYESKALGTGISPHGPQLGNLEWAHLPGTLRYG